MRERKEPPARVSPTGRAVAARPPSCSRRTRPGGVLQSMAHTMSTHAWGTGAGCPPRRRRETRAQKPGRRRSPLFPPLSPYLNHHGRIARHPAEALDRHFWGLIIADLDLEERERWRVGGER